MHYRDPLSRDNNLRRSFVIINVCAQSDCALEWTRSERVGQKVGCQHYLPESRIWKFTNTSSIWKAGPSRQLNPQRCAAFISIRRIFSGQIMYYENCIWVASSFDSSVVGSEWTQKPPLAVSFAFLFFKLVQTRRKRLCSPPYALNCQSADIAMERSCM